jgi:hypothetical protein
VDFIQFGQCVDDCLDSSLLCYPLVHVSRMRIAWIPRETYVRDRRTGKFEMRRCADGHLAMVRSLRDSRHTQQVADWLLLACVDAALEKM